MLGNMKELKMALHDCYVDTHNNTQPTEEELNFLLATLPKEIVDLALEWGGFDTVVRDKIFEWLLESK